jgi:Cu-processing system permease protein
MRAIRPLIAIARNTFRETVRDRILYVFLLFAFVITLGGLLLGSLSIGQDLRILEDLGLATIAFIGGIIAIFVGTNLVYKEIDRKTIYLIVTKPISRWQFIVGKYVGLALCVGVVTFVMGGFLYAVIGLFSPGHMASPLLLESVALIYLELLFVTALATFFSSFATPIMSIVFTLALWFIGHMGQSLRQLGALSDNAAAKQFCNAVYWLLPDLARLTQVRGELMYGHQIDAQLFFYLTAYILAYMILLLSVATVIMERREFS